MFVLCADRGVLIVQYRWELCPLRINKCLLSFSSHRQTYSSYIKDKVMAATPMAIHAQTWPVLVLHCGNCTCASSATTGYRDYTMHLSYIC